MPKKKNKKSSSSRTDSHPVPGDDPAAHVSYRLPYSLHCAECGSRIAKGVKLEAQKEVGVYLPDQICNYHTKCPCCESTIVIEDGLGHFEYLVFGKVAKYDSKGTKTQVGRKVPSAAEVFADQLKTFNDSGGEKCFGSGISDYYFPVAFSDS